MNTRTTIEDAIVIFFTNLFIIIFGIWVSVIPITKSKSFYMSHFEKNEYLKLYIEMRYKTDATDLLEKVADTTIDYFFGNLEEYQIEVDGELLFNEYEVRHMKDVKDLYIIGQIIGVISFFLLIACIFYLGKHFRRIRKKIIKYTACFYGFLLLFIIIFMIWGYFTLCKYRNYGYSVSYFLALFINFHRLIFPDTDKFLLATSQGPYDDVLYTLTFILDNQLFFDAGMIIGIVTISFIIIWFIIITVFYKLHPKICKKVDEIHERARNSKQTFNQS